MYDTFVIEERFGFNRTTPKTFVTDHLKSLLLTLILGGGLLALIIAIYLETGRWFWLLAWGTMGMVSLLGSLLYSSLIVPLFNKQTPCPTESSVRPSNPSPPGPASGSAKSS